ncbi:amino acid adenylation domain-containing protein [Zhouia spongiae]|uniref:Amino acid adenylation domain-containing protein n=1 Tax=Zhouia spongiae TaxID=2202721 RepID=A0ABY3YKG9_9FLAO|nr:non-ribosomal peptide synthetase/type I polyketide synthase [Zhouia spongiae]UNY98317.1 amino acid adenylation domain-containing protein [Zhouia spongiae]
MIRTISNLIEKYNNQGIKFIVKNDKLSIKTNRDSVPEEVLLEIKKNKTQIISFLKGNYYPLSYSQERLWFMDQYNHNSSYNMPGAIRFLGELNKEVLEKVLFTIVNRHEILRTNFVTINDEPKQVIHEVPTCHVEIINLSHLSKEESNKQILDLLKEESQKTFDLANDSLIRFKIYSVDKDESVLFINKHHIISDAWSASILINEITQLYEAFISGRPSPLKELPIQYGDYSIWQREYLEGELLQKQSKYWKGKLEGVSILELPTDKPRPKEQTFNGDRLPIHLNKDVTDKLNRLSRENDATLFMTLLSIFKILLHKYTGESDICVGSPIANRTREEVEGLIGLFVNTLALRSDVNTELSFNEFLGRVKQTTLEAYENQDLPFEKVVDMLEPERNLSYSPLFQVMMVLQNNPEGELKFSGLNVESVGIESTISKFEITLDFTETEKGLYGGIEYNTDLFDSDTIERMANHFKVLVEQLIENSQRQIKDIELLTSSERQQLLFDWNDTQVDYPKEKCIHQLFEEQSEKTPDNVAVVFEGDSLTYRELNERSNQLAYYLQSKGVKAESLVGICVERSLEMIVGLLGILKAGGAYVPIDPTYPEERISYMFKDTNCAIVLTQEQIELPKTNSEIIYLDSEWEKIAKAPRTNIETGVKGDNLAYVIYTSGSTGNPKGVMVEHKSLSNQILTIYNKFDRNFSFNDKCLNVCNISFDVSAVEIFLPLSYGSELHVTTKNDLLDVDNLSDMLILNQITFAYFPPSLLEIISSLLKRKKQNLNLNKLYVGVEPIMGFILESYVSLNPDIKILNAYGPTESTISCTSYKFNSGEYLRRNIPIGIPNFNTKCYIIGADENILPLGFIGELYVGGNQLARGYLNQPDLTRKKFIKDPFSKDPNSRLYKTGDLARYLPDGNIEFIGRLDDQVKIRGFRIELGEIESVLNQQDQVSLGVVLAKEDATGNKQLVGYVVPSQDVDASQGLKIEKLREALSKTLPDYMVPSLFVSLEAMPLTSNGKIDKRALPDPRVKAEEDYIAPSNDLEDRIVELWSDVLGVNKSVISINKSFFELGGNSLLSVKLQQKLNQLDEFENIQVSDLFKHHTIKRLVESVNPERLTEYKLQRNIQTDSHEVAIIGMSGAFSGVDNVTEFWDLIKNQDEGVRSYSREECEKLGSDLLLFEDPDYIPVSGHVKDIDQFDPLFWDISPNEAKLIDPQIRKFIEHCWFVLESSGYIDLRKEANIGVFAGSGNSSYLYNNILNGEMSSDTDLWEALIANNKDALATKTSYMLGLSGPSNSINTACSTGLVSVVEACKSLQLGTCEMALAGGVTFVNPNQIGYTYQEGMISSKDGHCRTFDETASGTIGGSGVGVVLLKRLEDAIKDEDNIIGVIKGYASNNDGDRKTDYTAPSITGQAECIINAQRMAGVSSDQIGYVECHGTATNLGDPIEVQALKEAFEFNSLKERGSKPGHKTVLGAVKANIGHADAAAGTAGLIKACLMLQNDIIPGQPNFNVPNPKLNLDQTNFEIVKQNRSWGSSLYDQRIIGVSSFGIGGTNAHVVIGDYLPGIKSESESKTTNLPSKKGDNEFVNYVVPISAKSKESLEFYKQELIKLLGEAHEDLRIEDLAFTLQEKREHYNYRSAYCGKDIKELLNNLQQYGSTKRINTEQKNKIVFMFPGQGSQYPCMGKELYDNDPYFKASIDKLIALANEHLEVDLYDVMYPELGNEQYDINETRWAQISIFIIEYAFAEYIEKLGIRADGYIGHSLGEYVAATLSGVFSLEDAIKIVIARAKLLNNMELGGMLAVNASEDQISNIVKEFNCEISLVNSIDDIVISGSDAAIKQLKEKIDNEKIPSVLLNTSYASHSRMMEHISFEIESLFSDIKLNQPKKIFISNLSGEIAKSEVSKGSYWYKHLRNTVQFAKGIDNLAEKFNSQISFIQIGPDDGLCYFVNKYKNVNNNKSIRTLKLLPSIREEKSHKYKNLNSKEDIFGKLWEIGIIRKPNDLKLFKHANKLTNLPTYQFDNKTCWINGNTQDHLNGQLKMLPKDKWLSTPIWSAVTNLSSIINKEKLFESALVFVRKDQLDSLDFTDIAKEIHIIVLGSYDLNLVNNSNSSLLFSSVVNESDFIEMTRSIKAQDIKYDAIIHCASIDNIDLLDDALNYNFYSIFLIHKYLLNVNYLKSLLVLTNNLAQITSKDSINPSNGTLVGATRNINHEFPNLDARVIDVGTDKSIIVPFVYQVITDETYKKSEELLAFRYGKLWKESFAKINPSFPENNLIENNDVILITGGLGGVGLAMANCISKKHKVTFVLVSRNNIDELQRSDYNKQKFQIIEEIRDNGSVVNICNVDISDVHQLNNLKEEIENKHGYINGIIHAAGVLPLPVDKYDLPNVKNAFKGKVYGINNIINTFNLSNSKYIALTSSLASIMGDVNRIEYCASNSYLDYLAVDKIGRKDIKIISTNWLGWIDIGMMKENSLTIEKDYGKMQGLGRLLQLNTVNQKEGAEVYYNLINQSNYDQVIISKLDINEVKYELFRKEQNYNQDVQFNLNEGNFTPTEYKIAIIWNKVLGVEEISVNDNFFELGGNSILATRVISIIRTEHSIELPLKSLFGAPDLRGFSNIVENAKSNNVIDKIMVTKSQGLFNDEVINNNSDCSINREKFKV